jgi:hypothetical protein
MTEYLWCFRHEEEVSWNSIGGSFFKVRMNELKEFQLHQKC